MTTEQRENFTHELRARLPKIAAELTKQTDAKWVYEPGTGHQTGDDLRGYLRRRDGLGIFCATRTWHSGTKPGQIHFVPDVPRDAAGQYPYISPEDKPRAESINVAGSKTDEQIARELVRRIVVEFEPLHAKLVADHDADRRYRANCETHAKRLAAAIRGEVHTYNATDPQRERRIYRHAIGGVSELKVNGAGVVSFELSVDIDTAIKLFADLMKRAPKTEAV
jgi:hypothetical protein